MSTMQDVETEAAKKGGDRPSPHTDVADSLMRHLSPSRRRLHILAARAGIEPEVLVHLMQLDQSQRYRQVRDSDDAAAAAAAAAAASNTVSDATALTAAALATGTEGGISTVAAAVASAQPKDSPKGSAAVHSDAPLRLGSLSASAVPREGHNGGGDRSTSVERLNGPPPLPPPPLPLRSLMLREINSPGGGNTDPRSPQHQGSGGTMSPLHRQGSVGAVSPPRRQGSPSRFAPTVTAGPLPQEVGSSSGSPRRRGTEGGSSSGSPRRRGQEGGSPERLVRQGSSRSQAPTPMTPRSECLSVGAWNMTAPPKCRRWAHPGF